MPTQLSQLNATGVPAQEVCERFITYVRERYPQLNSIKYRLKHNGNTVYLRARYKRRAIHAEGRDIEKTVNTFMFWLVFKLSIDRYYPTLEELRAKKPLEQFFVGFNCSVYWNVLS